MLRQATQNGMVTCYLVEGQYEANTNQIGFPVGMYAQVAIAARRAWNQLPTKGNLSGNIKHESPCIKQRYLCST